MLGVTTLKSKRLMALLAQSRSTLWLQCDTEVGDVLLSDSPQRAAVGEREHRALCLLCADSLERVKAAVATSPVVLKHVVVTTQLRLGHLWLLLGRLERHRVS